MSPKAILTDIEGTTSSIAFVHEVLFPYAARALPAYVRSHGERHPELMDAVRAEADEPEADLERIIAVLLRWIEEDRKVTALKALQGHVWTDGYKTGAFKGHIYPDAVAGLRRWHDHGIALYVYSSGSIKAQQLLFGHSEAGDLTPLFSGYFDTTSGHKREVESYRSIAAAMGVPAGDIVFLSDVLEELDAAKGAGMGTIQLVRESGMHTGEHRTVSDFSEIEF
ncbi:MAG: acireductone synthase [Myxococcota bacterium]